MGIKLLLIVGLLAAASMSAAHAEQRRATLQVSVLVTHPCRASSYQQREDATPGCIMAGSVIPPRMLKSLFATTDGALPHLPTSVTEIEY